MLLSQKENSASPVNRRLHRRGTDVCLTATLKTCGMKRSHEQAITRHLETLHHSTRCKDERCTVQGCSHMKSLVNHSVYCPLELTECVLCRRFQGLVKLHAKQCDMTLGLCAVPCCFQLRIFTNNQPVLESQSNRKRKLSQISSPKASGDDEEGHVLPAPPPKPAGEQGDAARGLSIDISCDSSTSQSLLQQAKPSSGCMTQQLLLLQHAGICSTSDNCNKTEHCSDMKKVFNHVRSCQDSQCSDKQCHLAKVALRHFAECSSSSCTVCTPLRC